MIVDLYAGIGISLCYFYNGRANACACLRNQSRLGGSFEKNLVENAVEDRCTVYLGDNAISGKKLIGLADRVNLGLLPDSIKGYAIAVDCLNPRAAESCTFMVIVLQPKKRSGAKSGTRYL